MTLKKSKARVKTVTRRPAVARASKRVVPGLSGYLSFANWDSLRKRLISGVRRSERLTKEDLQIRINARE